MNASRVSIILFLAIGLFTVGISAQGPPAEIEAALDDLSSRLGRTIALSHLSNWRWEEKNFVDSSLSCDTDTSAGSGTVGYRFRLTYLSVIYDYRVSHDSQVVLFCGQLNASEATPTPSATERLINRLCPDTAEPAPYMRSRIVPGMDVEASLDTLNLRAQPASAADVLLQIPAGLIFRVAAGPECSEGIVWWYALVNGQTGYVAEGRDGTYLVEPRRPNALSSRVVLDSSNIRQMKEFARVTGNFHAAHTWSSDGKRIALPGARGSDSIWIYDISDEVLTPTTFDVDRGMTTLEFRPNSSQLLYGGEEGTLHLWEFSNLPQKAPVERLFIDAHDGPISATAFSPDGEYFASAARLAYTQRVADRQWLALLYRASTSQQWNALAGHQGLIRTIAFSPDGNIIASGAEDGSLRFWADRNQPALAAIDLGSTVNTVAFSPDGRLLAVGLGRAHDNLLIFDAETRRQIAATAMPTSAITSLAFSPDSGLLAVGAADNFFTVWDALALQPLLTVAVEGAVGEISFSPDGTLIAVSTDKPLLAFHAVRLASG